MSPIGNVGPFSRLEVDRGVQLPMLRMSGVIPSLPMPSWCTQRQIYYSQTQEVKCEW